MARPGLVRHRKFLRLAHALDLIAAPYGELLARGALEALWECGYEAGDAYLGDATDVEAMAGWRGKPGALFNALIAAGGDGHAGFIEPCAYKPGSFQIHDLWHHCPDYVRKRRAREAERQAKIDPAVLAANSDEALGHAMAHADGVAADADRPLTGQGAPVSECQDGVARTPAPAPARAPAPNYSLVPEAGASDDRGPWARVEAVWKTHCVPAGSAASRVTDGQKKKAATRMREAGWFDAFTAACVFIASDAGKFYRGANDNGWAATLSWMLEKPERAVKIAERAGTRRPGGADRAIAGRAKFDAPTKEDDSWNA